ncbi:hypothetical protein Tco_1388965 [Tanacetum coccineum]
MNCIILGLLIGALSARDTGVRNNVKGQGITNVLFPVLWFFIAGKTIMEQVHELQVLVNKLKALSVPITEAFQVGATLTKLSPSWKSFSKKMLNKTKDYSLDDLLTYLRIKEEARTRDKRGKDVSNVYYVQETGYFACECKDRKSGTNEVNAVIVTVVTGCQEVKVTTNLWLFLLLSLECVKLDKFDGCTYTRWAEKMKFLLIVLKIYYVLDPELPPIPANPVPEPGKPMDEKKVSELENQHRKSGTNEVNMVNTKIAEMVAHVHLDDGDDIVG